MHRLVVLLFIVGISACSESKKEHVKTIPDIRIDASDTRIEAINRILFFEGEPFSGQLISYYPNGKLKSEDQYFNGQLEGSSRRFFDNGSLSQKRYYHQNEKIGIHEGWWKNGNRKFYYEFESGFHHGELKEWFYSGALARNFHYELGKEVGSQQMWDEDGSIRANYVVKNGRRYGLIGLKNCKSVSDEEGLFASVKY